MKRNSYAAHLQWLWQLPCCSDAQASKTETTAAAGETTAAAAGTTAEAAKAETNGEKLKVTLLVTGSFGDKAFNDSAQAGMEKLEAELGDKVGNKHGRDGQRQDKVRRFHVRRL